MPIPTGGLYQITVNGSFGTKAFQNVFYFWESGNTPTVSMAALAGDFDTKVMPDIAAVMSVAATFEALEIKDVLGLNPDVLVPTAQVNGSRVGEQFPSYASMGYTYNGLTTETRKGAKRFSGLSETDVSGNVITAAYRTVCETLAAVLDNSIFDGVTSYGPVIFGIPNATRPTNVVNPVSTVLVDAFVTTQNSRKRK